MPGTELATGYVSLVPSGRGFGRQIIREAQSAGSAAGNAASSNFGSRFVSGMARIGRTAGLALAGGVAAAGFFGIRVAADFEQTRIAFEGILGDVDKATALLGDLRDFAAKTPFEFTGLAESAKNLLAVGFEADEIIPTMAILGNVAATLGVGETEIAGVVRALGQMRGKGKASAEELQQISEQIPGFSAIGAIAKDMGITTEEAFDRMAAGAIPADEAIESILNGMEDFPGAAGAMERQSKTLNGVISTFTDTMTGIAIDFITPYLPALSSGIQSLSDWIQTTLVPALQTFVDWVGDIVDRVGPGIVSLFRDHITPTVKGLVDDGLNAISDWWDRNGDNITGFFQGLADALLAIAEPIGTWIWETMLPAFADFGGWLIDNEAVLIGALAGITAGVAAYAAAATAAAIANILAFLPFILIGVAIALLVAQIYYLWQNSELFRETVGSILALILIFGPKVIDFFRDVWRWANAAWDIIGDLLGRIKDLIELIPELPAGGDIFGGFLGGWPGLILEKFDDGGTVGGRRGAPRLILAHGGETVLPTHKAELADFMGGGGSFVNGNLVVQQLQGEDAGDAVYRTHRKIRLMAAI